MELFFLQAECGDAAYISYNGNDNQIHHVFIDAGFERTFKHVLADSIAGARVIDLFVISHIHDDHIGGAIAYTRAITRGEVEDKVLQWYYNSPRPMAPKSVALDTITTAASISQGDELTAYLSRHQKLQAIDILNTMPTLDLYGLKLTWLSPSEYSLNRLRIKYADPLILLEREENSAVSGAAGATGDDYYLKIEGFNLNKWEQDDNIENGSSIAFLSEIKGSRVLWLADAHPTQLIQSLEDLGYTPGKRLKCDYVKVTHHGSKGNNSDSLYDLIDCHHYVISADGVNRHYLPSKESLVRILCNKQRDVNANRYHFYFTYDNSVLRGIFDVDGPDVFDKWNFECHFIPSGQKWLKLPDTAIV